MIFSGVQPSAGAMHLGNYVGAVRRWVKLQDSHKCIFCIVDLHTLTCGGGSSADVLRTRTMHLLAEYIACGLDPHKNTIFLQSSVPEHTELCWILGCLTPMGWLNRMTQFKDKKESATICNIGLYGYPVLMAADILLYQTNLVPVGNDQQQHIELAQNIAKTFNSVYNVDYFRIPRALDFDHTGRVMSLRNADKKMSKSDTSDLSRINLNDEDGDIVQKIRKATTDSIPGFAFESLCDRPAVSNLVNIFAALSDSTHEEVCNRFERSSTTAFKDALSELLIQKIAPLREKAKELLQDTSYLQEVLAVGNASARKLASKHIKEIKEIVGLYSTC